MWWFASLVRFMLVCGPPIRLKAHRGLFVFFLCVCVCVRGLFDWRVALSNRGPVSCPRCSEGYSNCVKLSSCPTCGCDLECKFQPKKAKSSSAPIVEICLGLFSCRTTGRDDRHFITNQDRIWLCTREDCKLSRSIHVNTMRAHKAGEELPKCKPLGCVYTCVGLVFLQWLHSSGIVRDYGVPSIEHAIGCPSVGAVICCVWTSHC